MYPSKFLLKSIKLWNILVRFYAKETKPILSMLPREDMIIIHGGASNFEDSIKKDKIKGVKEAALLGYQVLQDLGDPMEACEKAIRYLESSEVFNCGHGSVLNENGHVEMDASIMVGSDLTAGGVAAVKDILHPISVARKIMEKSPHIILASEGAHVFAKNLGLELAMPGGLVTKRARKRHKDNTIFDQKELGTVGAVCLSKEGRLAAGTSSGGLNRKKEGRVGHAARPGCGCFADDLICAVSTSGHGESIATMCLANLIAKSIEAGLTPMEALVDHFRKMRKFFQNNGGAIVVTKTGDMGIFFTTKRMPYAFIRGGKIVYGGADKGDEKSEDVS
ncbi:isoaspartyl peptidase/L-asparaginase-like [Onthophagus taurus]|uniref:isoaspartyl peptidase/L-asparaginase-like n=1 Tax=Onthophagus taurus TaxID=166361 RepID=UPI000C208059|nr:isoaspartyl peptidase/L-asparaginase-like [Onthophagus taurus]